MLYIVSLQQFLRILCGTVVRQWQPASLQTSHTASFYSLSLRPKGLMLLLHMVLRNQNKNKM